MIAKTKARHEKNGLSDDKINARDDLSLMITEPEKVIVLWNLHLPTYMYPFSLYWWAYLTWLSRIHFRSQIMQAASFIVAVRYIIVVDDSSPDNTAEVVKQ
jgi:hypothetical protein